MCRPTKDCTERDNSDPERQTLHVLSHPSIKSSGRSIKHAVAKNPKGQRNHRLWEGRGKQDTNAMKWEKE